MKIQEIKDFDINDIIMRVYYVDSISNSEDILWWIGNLKNKGFNIAEYSINYVYDDSNAINSPIITKNEEDLMKFLSINNLNEIDNIEFYCNYMNNRVLGAININSKNINLKFPEKIINNVNQNDNFETDYSKLKN